MPILEHGGRLRAAARQWNIPLADWLDLSTGIAPWSYPVNIPAEVWQRLPEDDDELEATAARYYHHPSPLPLPGSQAAIQWLPRLFSADDVILPTPTYGEYAPAWQVAGHRVSEVSFAQLIDAARTRAKIVMLGNPNNPTGETLSATALSTLAQTLAARDGWLIVDEAFTDADSARSLTALAGNVHPNLIVLRSLGKFFGLAGARVGFFCGADHLRIRLKEMLGPWAVAHPARLAATQALSDTAWHTAQQHKLASACTQLGAMLDQHGLASTAGGNLFRYVATAQAGALFAHLARRGILVRQFDAPAALRFGLPITPAHWQQLDIALSEWTSA